VAVTFIIGCIKKKGNQVNMYVTLAPIPRMTGILSGLYLGATRATHVALSSLRQLLNFRHRF